MDGYHLAKWAARAMRGTITVGSLASNYSYNSLYNNSSGAEVLIVRLLQSLSAGVTFFGVQFVAGQYGVVAGKVTRVQAGEAVHAGVLLSNQQTTVPAPDFNLYFNTVPIWTDPNYPIAIIPPNWSLAAVAPNTSQAFATSWLWDVIPASDLMDLGIDPMSDPANWPNQ